MRDFRFAKCQKCGVQFDLSSEWEAQGQNPKLCYYCFEDGVEEADQRRRERIARENEY